MKKSSPHEKGAHITSDVIMSWFRTFIVKSWISQTQYLVPANVLGLLLLWVTKISLLASGLLHKVRNLLSPLPNVLCLTAAADNESFFFFSYLSVEARFCHHLDFWGLKQLFILDQPQLTRWRLSLSSILRSADWVMNWNSLAVWLLTITSWKKEMKPFISHRDLKCVIVCWSLQVLNPEQRRALPRRSHCVLLSNLYFCLISNTHLANSNQVEVKPVQRRGGTLITHITRRASELSITRLAGLVLCIPTASAGRSPVH